MKKYLLLACLVILTGCHVKHKIVDSYSHQQNDTAVSSDTSSLHKASQTKTVDSTKTTVADNGLTRITEHEHSVTDGRTGNKTTDIDRTIEHRADIRTEQHNLTRTDQQKQATAQAGYHQQQSNQVKDKGRHTDTTITPSYGLIIWVAGILALVFVAWRIYRG
ncbi:hypothetical protein HQ865_01125 [Mucilaginibacter mali]|uniref:Uncharacterized protein n=1 Tax=Mucilaginibacter mali TaxID=2740462 RepID=A0A7D4UE11_9SPHI|nr:hypothetical protein [Mucilaginibacter mali]QKJ28416.1 hypothetical protein HQ865_01125 [Mucilaginibacter mali]